MKKIRDFFGEGEEPPNLVPLDEPVFGTPRPRVSSRLVPQSRTDIHSEVSSADPNELEDAARTFASYIVTIEDCVNNAISLMRDFSEKCQWGCFDAQGLLLAGSDWVMFSRDDVRWLQVVASAFRDAGSNGGMYVLSDAAIKVLLESKNLNEYRSALVFEPASVSGIEPTNGYAGDPVHVATGNFVEPEIDIAFTGLARDLSVERTYNSLNRFSGVFGLGWHSTFDQHIRFEKDAFVLVRGDGREFVFEKSLSYPIRARLADLWLEVGSAPAALDVTGECFIVCDNRGRRKYFNSDGRWLGDYIASDQYVTVEYNSSGYVSLVKAANGRAISIEYVDGHVHSIRSRDGRGVSYRYDTGLLAAVIKATGMRQYRWNAESLIDQVIAEDGVIEVDNTYDEKSRVIQQVTPQGREIRFSYLSYGVTVVSERDGSGCGFCGAWAVC